MKIVMLIGAGATLAESLPSRPSPDRTPPLDTTFLNLCEKCRFKGFPTVYRYAKGRFGIDLNRDECRMEELFNYLYTDIFMPTPPKGSLEAYWQLIKIYILALKRTTDTLEGRSQKGVGALLRYVLAKGKPDEIVFVTFNQDLVIEKSIDHIARLKKYSSIPWNIEETYNLDFQTRTMRGDSRPFTHTGNSSILVLKLHGSLNWRYTVRSESDPRNSLRQPRTTLYCLNDKIIRDITISGSSRRPSIPLLVPPIFEKTTIHRKTISPLWEKAEEEISQADELIIFGYSFPNADVAARSLLKRAFHKNKKVSEFSVIDVNPNIASIISELLSSNAAHYYYDVPTFSKYHY